MTNLAESLRAALSGRSAVALPLALLGGLLSGASPCCVALYPAAAATCCVTRDTHPLRAARLAAAFVLGIGLSTSLLGVIAALAGHSLSGLGGWTRYLIAAVPIVISFHFFGWLRLPLPPAVTRKPAATGMLGAFLSGLLLSLAFVPCGTPLLAAVMSFAAYRRSVIYGAALLFLYGLGAGLPVLPLGAFAGTMAAKLEAKGWRFAVDRATGVLLLAFGLYAIWTA